jgi:hypothetical protein
MRTKTLMMVVGMMVVAIAACSSILGIEDTRVQPDQPLDCPLNRANCDNNVDNGCEADLSSATACGGCNVQCGGGTPLCADSGSSFACTGQCDAPSQICGAACVDLSQSPTNCGRCGHDCGGGTCIGGQCQPVLVADAADQLDAPTALTVNDRAIFWNERNRIRSCPLPLGCALAPALIADAYGQLKAIVATTDSVFFSGCRACDDNYRVYQCPTAGCPPAEPTVRTSLIPSEQMLTIKSHLYWSESSEAVLGCELSNCRATVTRWPRSTFGPGEVISITGNADTLYVKGSGANLTACPEAAGCSTPTALPNSETIPSTFQSLGSRFYWLTPGPTTGQVRTCLSSNCNNGELFAVDSYGGTELRVDDTGVYWLNPTQGTLRHCPLAACAPGGAATLATGLTTAKALTLGPGFVYWITGNTIEKVAKP